MNTILEKYHVTYTQIRKFQYRSMSVFILSVLQIRRTIRYQINFYSILKETPQRKGGTPTRTFFRFNVPTKYTANIKLGDVA